MKYDNVLYNFISPVTGRVLCDPNYVLLGDLQGIATPSPILIDMQLDINKIRQNYNILRNADFVIGHPNDQLPNAQVLNTLENGFLFNTEGNISIVNTIAIDNLPDLTKNYLWIGDENNRPAEVSTIQQENLPDLKPLFLWQGGIIPKVNFGRPTQTLTISTQNLPFLTDGYFWLGGGIFPLNNRPTETKVLPIDNLTSLTDGYFWLGGGISPLDNRPTETKVLPIDNLTNLTSGKFWQGNASNRPVETDISFSPTDAQYVLNTSNPSLPNAQDLSALTTVGVGAMMAKIERTTGKVAIATAGVDYITPTELEEAIEAQAAITTTEIAEAIAAQAAITTAEIAAAIAAQAAITTEEIAAAIAAQATLTTIEIAIAIAAAVVPITIALFGLRSAVNTLNTRIDNLTLHQISLHTNNGDVAINPIGLQKYKIIRVANPTDPQDVATKYYVDAHIVTLRGTVTGTGTINTGIDTTLSNNIAVAGQLQRFTFNNSLFSFQLDNDFTPTPPNNITTTNFEFRNATTSGFRWQHNTRITDTFGSLSLESFINGDDIGDTILTFTQSEKLEIFIPVVIEDSLDMATNNIINVKDPINLQDAATKNYVDNQVSGEVGSITLTGFTVGEAPVSGVITTSPGIADNDLDMGNYNIINISDPINLQDAATKHYVDNQVSSGIDSITLTGFTVGEAPVSGVIATSPGIADNDLNMGGFRIKNLAQSPVEDFDAVSTTFLWDLIHDRVDIIWS